MEKNLAAEIVKKYGLIMALSLVLLLSVVDIFFVTVSQTKIEQIDLVNVEKSCQSEGDGFTSDIPRISEINVPMISSEAASSVCQTKDTPICKDLGSNLWVLLLISYIALLVFNLSYGFQKNAHIQWAWESVMTAIFISFWFIFDTCAQNLWYPLYVTKLAIATYFLYLYFMINRRKELGE